MRTGGLADRAALFELATLAAAAEPAASITRLPIVLLDVPIPSQAERAFVGALASVSPEVLVTVPEGDERTLAALEELGARREDSTRVLEELSARHADSTPQAPARVSASSPGGASALAHLREYLFAEAAPAAPAEPGEAVFFSAPGEGREAVEIARRITEEARDGTPFDRMAILLRAPVAYSSLFETALHRAGIPAFFARGARRPDPAGRALLLLLDCALEKLSARRFAEYLSLGQVPTPGAGGAPPTGRRYGSRRTTKRSSARRSEDRTTRARAPTQSRTQSLPAAAPPTRPRARSSRAACARPGSGSGFSSTRR